MIIWINGTFGVGKSAVAYELKRQLSKYKTVVLDSDEEFEKIENDVIEDMIHNGGGTLPQTNLFFLNHMKKQIDNYLCSDTICIVSMALISPECLEIIWKGLSEDSEVFKHYILEADIGIIIERINNDHNRLCKNCAVDNLINNLEFLKNNFSEAKRIDTSNKNIESIVNYICDDLKL